MTFSELEDIGKIEKIVKNDISYYYLTSFNTFGEGETARLQTIERGVKDATVTIRYQDKPITFSTYKKILAKE